MKVKREKLLEVLKAVAPAVAKKDLVQQSTTFLFLDDRVCTYNDQASVSAAFQSGVTASVKADPLLRLLNKLPDEDVDIELAEGEFKVSTPRVRSAVASEATIHLDIARLVGEPPVWVKLPEGFAEAVGLCLHSVGTDISRPDLASLHLMAERAESGHHACASRYSFPSPWTGLKKLGRPDLLLPGWAAPDLLGYKPIEVGVTDGWLHFRNEEGTTYSCRQLATTYPDIDFIFAGDGTKLVFPAGVEEALDRAGVFSESEFAVDEHVRIMVKESTMQITGKGVNGWLKERLALERPAAEPFGFDIHPAFLLEVLSHTPLAIVGKDKVKLGEKGGRFCHVVALSYVPKE